jgi:hypothetical protein
MVPAFWNHISDSCIVAQKEAEMALNKPIGDNARKVKKRSQLKKPADQELPPSVTKRAVSSRRSRKLQRNLRASAAKSNAEISFRSSGFKNDSG